MNGDDKKYLSERLVKLETLFSERWDNHDKRSEERWKELQGNIKAIFSKFGKLQCDVHVERMKNIDSTMVKMWALIVLVLSGCVGGFLWMLRIL